MSYGEARLRYDLFDGEFSRSEHRPFAEHSIVIAALLMLRLQREDDGNSGSRRGAVDPGRDQRACYLLQGSAQ